jgi:NADH-quinone oxidoreductase subunit A
MLLFTNYIYFQYFPIFVFSLVCILVTSIIILLSFISSKQLKDAEKVSAYECGFDPFNYKDVQSILNIRFYLVGILFIIFDIEVVFLVPWSMSLNKLGSFGYWTMVTFLVLLTIGFVYEWKKGALEWE